MLPPAATAGEVWHAHQVPALTRAGFRVITVNHRGMPPSPVPAGPYRIADLVADVAALIDELRVGECHLIGSSLGAFVAQEVALAHPGSVRSAVLMGTRARTDQYRRRLARALAVQTRRAASSSELDALMHLSQLFGPKALADDRRMADWLELRMRFPIRGAGAGAQYDVSVIGDRREALSGINRPCLVVAFDADVITPVEGCREVSETIPGAAYEEFAELGHFGFLEDPDAVNASVIEFLRKYSG